MIGWKAAIMTIPMYSVEAMEAIPSMMVTAMILLNLKREFL